MLPTKAGIVALTTAMAAHSGLPQHAQANVENLWYASRSASAKGNWLLGEDTCDPRVDGNCNPCMPNVEEQFDRALDGGEMSWVGKQWHFDWDRRYSPSRITSNQAYLDDEKVVIRNKHVQGFVRTNFSDLPFAITHSGDSVGSLSIIAQSSTGHKTLLALHRTSSAHPGSLATLGKYVVFPDVNGIRFVDVSRATSPQNIWRTLPGAVQINSDKSGGMGMAKINGDGHLIAFVTGGQTEPSTRRIVYLYHEGPLENPNRIEYLGDQSFGSVMAAWPSSVKNWDGAKFPENTSMISECGTGNLYTVHFGAPTDSLNGTAVIHLARLDWGENGPYATTVGMYKREQDDASCFFEGGASAGSVDYWQPGKLRIECHERVTRTERYFNFVEATFTGDAPW